mgnify:CR=1 FL=1
MSPRPTSFSAPVSSRMMREFTESFTAKEMRMGGSGGEDEDAPWEEEE